MAKIALSVADVAALMGRRFDRVDEVELLTGGAWSSAFRFLAAGRPMVIKFGRYREERLRASMLHIGVAALQYQAFAGLPSDLAKTSGWMRSILAFRP